MRRAIWAKLLIASKLNMKTIPPKTKLARIPKIPAESRNIAEHLTSKLDRYSLTTPTLCCFIHTYSVFMTFDRIFD
ncbi:MAG: hypothetical protein OEY22_02840 [Candidatus Bathyarchaeota archaeon]|nr:hypothetical protein [Candidatus Bathyarchaeota archaeon]